jgi:hypothetical protein
MKATMLIPSYWGRQTNVGWQEKDAIYDHPTPLDQEGTLLRVIQSMDILEDTDFKLVIIAVATASDIEAKVEEKVKQITQSIKPKVELLLFSHSHLKKIHHLLISLDKEDYIPLLQLRGYSNIRNICLWIAHILDSEIAILIDDDEIFKDAKFIHKAREFIGRRIGGRVIDAVAGYYETVEGGYHLKKDFYPWMAYWDQYGKMNEAFDEIIGTAPRLKETPFVFGGNMVIHRDLFRVVPFDPNVPRGEDIDYLMNARMFGFYFFLDNELSIVHDAPPKSHPTWRRLREDIYRFIFERAKIESQIQMPNMTIIFPEEFDPYPGYFLKEDLEEKIYRSNQMLALDYLVKGDKIGSEEALKNISLAKMDAVPKFDPFENLIKLQKSWQEMMEYTSQNDIVAKIKDIIKF